VDVTGSKESPPIRSYHAMTANSDGLYVFAGCHGHDRLNDIWKFDAGSNQWSLLGEKSEKRPAIRGGPAITADGDVIYLHGGYQGPVIGESDDLWCFDLRAGKWESLNEHIKGDKPLARSVHSIVALGGDKLFSWGGEGTASKTGHMGAGEYWGDGWYYDIKNKTWTQSENDETRSKQDAKGRPSPRGWFAMDKLDSNTVVLFGGFDGTKGEERLGDLYTWSV